MILLTPSSIHSGPRDAETFRIDHESRVPTLQPNLSPRESEPVLSSTLHRESEHPLSSAHSPVRLITKMRNIATDASASETGFSQHLTRAGLGTRSRSSSRALRHGATCFSAFWPPSELLLMSSSASVGAWFLEQSRNIK